MLETTTLPRTVYDGPGGSHRGWARFDPLFTPQYGADFCESVAVADYFLKGQCHALALAVNEATGWPMVLVTRHGTTRRAWRRRRVHVMCQHPTGYVVDSTALVPLFPDLFDYAPLSRERLDSLVRRGVLAAPDINRAREVLPTLLARIEADTL